MQSKMKEKLKLIKEWIINNKKVMVIVLGGIFVFIIAMVSFCFLIPSQEKTLKNYLEEMGKEFYEELYYDQVGNTENEKKEFLSKFHELGIKVSLDSLSRFHTEQNQNKLDAFVNQKTNQECDRENSKVIIYPNEPYGKGDYNVEIQLVCGF